MYKAFILILSLLFVTAFSEAQNFRTINNHAFKRGEKLEYRVYYHSLVTGKVTAGEGTLEVKAENRKFNNRNTMHIVGIGKSKGAFNWFYKVNDRFETYIDEEAMFPWMFVNRTREGGYTKDDDVTFDQDAGKAVQPVCPIMSRILFPVFIMPVRWISRKSLPAEVSMYHSFSTIRCIPHGLFLKAKMLLKPRLALSTV